MPEVGQSHKKELGAVTFANAADPILRSFLPENSIAPSCLSPTLAGPHWSVSFSFTCMRMYVSLHIISERQVNSTSRLIFVHTKHWVKLKKSGVMT